MSVCSRVLWQASIAATWGMADRRSDVRLRSRCSTQRIAKRHQPLLYALPSQCCHVNLLKLLRAAITLRASLFAAVGMVDCERVSVMTSVSAQI